MRVKVVIFASVMSLVGMMLSAQTVNTETLASEWGNPGTMTLSPDALSLAWTDPQEGLCVHHFAEASTQCTPFPNRAGLDEAVDLRDHTALRWSPDNTMIAFTENWTQNFTESDLWLFDAETRTFTNRTNDDVSGSAIMLDQQDTPYFLDTMPIWNPATGDLYFFRYVRQGRTYTTALYRIPQLGDNFAGVIQGEGGLAEGEPEQIADFSDLPALSVYNGEEFNFEGGAAISRDGRQLAFLSRPATPDRAALWLIDLQTGETTTPLSFEAIQQAGLPEWSTTPMQFDGLAWRSDDSLVISTAPSGTLGGEIPLMLYTYDLDSATLTPLIDLSNVPDETAYVGGEYDSPRSAVLTPERDGILAYNFNRLAERSDLSLFDFASETSQVLYTISLDAFEFVPMSHPSVGSNDGLWRVLMYGYLFKGPS